ncbi:hypothetical protein [Eikenella glucosivorans]|nr:hypothetical protein [Eikenella glucosivorans]
MNAYTVITLTVIANLAVPTFLYYWIKGRLTAEPAEVSGSL